MDGRMCRRSERTPIDLVRLASWRECFHAPPGLAAVIVLIGYRLLQLEHALSAYQLHYGDALCLLQYYCAVELPHHSSNGPR